MKQQLERKTRYFFSSTYRGRNDVHNTLRELQCMGRVVVIGGMLRDLALFGNAEFCSDLDFVIDPKDPGHFEERMLSIGARINRFGGYALPCRKWKVDVWALRQTWAHSAGHVKVRTFGDLRKATFFNCDAIIYDVSTKKINTTEDYFDRLRKLELDVNLRPNPNPLGNAVRAFRYALLKGFLWAPDLAKFVSEVLEEFSWDRVIERENRSFNSRYIARLDRKALERDLSRYLSQHSADNFNAIRYRKDVQLGLPL